MDNLDTLLATLPVAHANPPSIDLQLLDRARFNLLSHLAQAEYPVHWLNRLHEAIDAQPTTPEQWRLLLPSGIADLADAIALQPEVWRHAADAALEVQAREYAELLPLGSQPPGYPARLNDRYLQDYLQRLLTRFGQAAPSSASLAPWRAQHDARHAGWTQVQRILQRPMADWRRLLQPLREATLQAMRAEARLQQEEGQLPSEASRLLFPQGQGDQHVVWLAVQHGQARVPGVWVLADKAGWQTGQHSMPWLLWVQGEGGGLMCVDDRQRLLQRLRFTLQAGGLPAAASLEEVEGVLQLVASNDGLVGLFDDLLGHWQATLAQQVDLIQAERWLQMARAALMIPADTCRVAALAQAERQWQMDALIEHMPAWVLSRSYTERQAYARQLQAYHNSSMTLEAWLQVEAPLFPEWAGQLLKTRLQQDLGIEVAVDEILLWRPDPSLDYTLPYVASTVAELACEGFDPDSEDEVTRLNMARWPEHTLDPGYLGRVLTALDPLRQYQEKVRAAFDLNRAENSERLSQPYRLELQLLAAGECWRNVISEAAAQMLRLAAAAQTRQSLVDAGLELHWPVVTSSEELGQSIEGVGMLVDASGRTLICMPDAPQGLRLIERESKAEALSALADAIRTRNDVAAYVAQRCGNDPVALLSYLRQAAQRNYEGYLSSAVALEPTLVGIRLAGCRNRRIAQARAQGRSQASIHKDNVQANHLRHIGYLRAALGVVPGLGSWYSVEDIYHGAQEIAEAWRTGSNLQLLGGAVSVVAGLVDILLTALPFGASAAALRRVVRRVAQQRTARLPFTGYAAGHPLVGAEPLKGADANTWRHNGQQYIWQDGLAYAVYRRSGESTLRLRATATRLYEAPVQRDGARWVMHADVGLRGGGGKLTTAEKLFADFGPNSRHQPLAGSSRPQAVAIARRLLARYEFPGGGDFPEEFAYAYIQDGAPPAWARQYLRQAGGSADVTPPGQGWQAVRWNMQASAQIQVHHDGWVSVRFGNRGESYPGVRVQGHYYPILPNNHTGGLVYIAPTGALPDNLQQLDALIEYGAGPVRVQLGATAAEAPEVLGAFEQTFRQRLANRFPSLSDASVTALGETLYRSADPNTGALTQRRLNRLLARLDEPTLDPLQEMSVRPLNGVAVHMPLRTGDSSLRQLAWDLLPSEHLAMRAALADPLPSAMTALLRSVIMARGYQIMTANSTAERTLVLFTRRGLRNVYVLLQQRRLGQLSLQGGTGVPLLSDAWLDTMISSMHNLQQAAALRSARRQGLLRPLLGGLHLHGSDRTALVWERVRMTTTDHAQPSLLRNWRHDLRPVATADRELPLASGLYGSGASDDVAGVSIDGRLLPVFAAPTSSHIFLSRSSSLPAPLTFEALDVCIRERFGEQPWLIVSGHGGWTVRRPLFPVALGRRISDARSGLTRQSALNAARHVFERGQVSDHQRLLELERVTFGWAVGNSRLDDAADPLLLLDAHQLPRLQAGHGWQLALPVETATARPLVYHLSPVDGPGQQMLAAVSGTRMRQHALSAVDDMLVRYGLVQQYRNGGSALYHHPVSNRVYLVALAVSEQETVQFPLQDGLAMLSADWLQTWRLQLPAAALHHLQAAEASGQVIRMTAVLRLGQGPHIGQVALLRVADF
ncbi:hypothetical protein ACIPW4_16145 [Pseudomonas sp. NPDC089996]|uniref:hypothetical protein n=1 Tax=Pseudomonas sp. NPDC089996 TaxID=3364474 RepID=UPI003826FBBC